MDGKILVVDDDASIRLLVSDVLEDQGLAVSTAASGVSISSCWIL